MDGSWKGGKEEADNSTQGQHMMSGAVNRTQVRQKVITMEGKTTGGGNTNHNNSQGRIEPPNYKKNRKH